MATKLVGVRRLSAITVIALAMAPVTALSAEDEAAGQYQKALEQWSSTIAELAKADSENVATTEIELIRSLVGQGQAFVAQERLEKVDPLLKRCEALVHYINAKRLRHATEGKAAAAEARASAAEQKAEAARQAADAVQQKYEELESKGL